MAKRRFCYDEKCEILAEHFIQDNPGIPVQQLAQAIQEAIENFIENYDPTPYCSYGHMTKESCDCGPIAENE
jgi:hypothetical protein